METFPQSGSCSPRQLLSHVRCPASSLKFLELSSVICSKHCAALYLQFQNTKTHKYNLLTFTDTASFLPSTPCLVLFSGFTSLPPDFYSLDIYFFLLMYLPSPGLTLLPAHTEKPVLVPSACSMSLPLYPFTVSPLQITTPVSHPMVHLPGCVTGLK